jgi:branched-subunit amino acid transport protein
MKLWLTILAAGLLTYSIRLSFIFLIGKINTPLWLRRALRFVPIAVLTAIIIPELFLPDGVLDISFFNARLMAGALAILVAWRTRNVVATIFVGMVGLWIIQWILH